MTPLQYNGGPTRTHAPISMGTQKSLAIDAGNNAIDDAIEQMYVEIDLDSDQRGFERPVDFGGINSPGIKYVDIGALELFNGELYAA